MKYDAVSDDGLASVTQVREVAAILKHLTIVWGNFALRLGPPGGLIPELETTIGSQADFEVTN